MSEKHKYGSPEDVAQRILEWLGQNARQDATSLLLYEAMQALKKYRASPADQVDYKAMFTDAARDMAAIDAALGIDPEEAGGSEPILIAIEDLKTSRDAWKAYAEHQEHCAICGEAVSDCGVGSSLRDASMSATPPAAAGE